MSPCKISWDLSHLMYASSPSYVARGLHLCGRTRLGYLSGTETPWVLVGDVS
ncbi:hypothetical protein Hanom_Chr04g00380051 [Helianthus anomalus]